MAGLYFGLCLFDYGIRPVVNYYEQKAFNMAETVDIIRELEPNVQIEMMRFAKEKESIPPILSETVHLAFGAILGIAAYTRGREKEAIVRNQNNNDNDPK